MTTSSPGRRPAAASAVIGDDRLRAAELLTVLVDAELARGDLRRGDDGMRRTDGPHR